MYNNILITREELHPAHRGTPIGELRLQDISPVQAVKEASAVVFLDDDGTTRVFKHRGGPRTPSRGGHDPLAGIPPMPESLRRVLFDPNRDSSGDIVIPPAR